MGRRVGEAFTTLAKSSHADGLRGRQPLQAISTRVLEWQGHCIVLGNGLGIRRTRVSLRGSVQIVAHNQSETGEFDSEAAGPESGELIRRVATNQRSVVLLMALGALAIWLGAVNLGFSDMAGRWLVRQMGPIANPENATAYFLVGAAALTASFVFWTFNGTGNRAFELSASGITQYGMGGSTLYPWASFRSLERNVGAITLYLANPEPGMFGTKTVVFTLAAIDWSSTELEALIVYHRPDLFSAASQFNQNRTQPITA